MRSTRASAAVDRLKRRSENPFYSMSIRSDGTFVLMLASDDASAPVAQGEPLPMDEFVKFVDAFGPQKPRRVSKLDVAFEAQLAKRKKSDAAE